MIYDRNIRFENNKVETFDNRIVWANRVDGLSITGNQIHHKPSAPALYPEASLFDFTNCKNVTVAKNTYIGSQTKIIKSDSESRKTLEVVLNTGFSNAQN